MTDRMLLKVANVVPGDKFYESWKAVDKGIRVDAVEHYSDGAVVLISSDGRKHPKLFVRYHEDRIIVNNQRR